MPVNLWDLIRSGKTCGGCDDAATPAEAGIAPPADNKKIRRFRVAVCMDDHFNKSHVNSAGYATGIVVEAARIFRKQLAIELVVLNPNDIPLVSYRGTKVDKSMVVAMKTHWRRDFKHIDRDAAICFSGRRYGKSGVASGSIYKPMEAVCVVRGGRVETVAHELAHLLGASHTGKPWLMARSVSSIRRPFRFSQKTRQNIAITLERAGQPLKETGEVLKTDPVLPDPPAKRPRTTRKKRFIVTLDRERYDELEAKRRDLGLRSVGDYASILLAED